MFPAKNIPLIFVLSRFKTINDNSIQELKSGQNGKNSFIHAHHPGWFCGGANGEMDWINVDDEIFDFAGDNTDKADTALYGRLLTK
jgi:hypothetical protein